MCWLDDPCLQKIPLVTEHVVGWTRLRTEGPTQLTAENPHIRYQRQDLDEVAELVELR